ncbi:MAG: class I mannose-6-phosphate isomerase [Chloroflexota bacterium]|nr:class I mannose-6-phosphate isomerase [Chloroflexota bacterium]
MTTQQEFENRTEALNQPTIQLHHDDEFKVGWDEIGDFIGQIVMTTARDKSRVCMIGIDGYVGTDWPATIERLETAFVEKGIRSVFLNAEDCLKSEAEIDEILQPYLGDDPVFGRLYKKGLKSLYDSGRLATLRNRLRELRRQRRTEQPQVIVCYGTGALLNTLRPLYDFTIYVDLTRETVLKRNRKWNKLAGKTQSIGPKKLYYVDFQVNDRHRNRLLNRLDFYIDGNNSPILLSTRTLQKITTALASWPFKLKYLYEPGPWGGQWLKKIRHLPDDWVNCAWSYEVIAQEMSLLVAVKGTTVELPWTTFLYLQYDRVMGNVPKRRFGGEFPIRYDYLDTMDGGDLSIQVHPTTPYIREQFGEHYHQGEMYYIVAAKKGATVNLGLNEETKREEFLQAARLADEEGIEFNYRDYINNVPAQKHDLLLIPPGTVHGSGEGLVVLEISATTYRYTFKIYDHLRPDLNGLMRPIHVKHAFNVIKWFRRSKWVARNLKQEPRLTRSGDGWAEYMIGDRREFFHVVFRLEFDHQIEDDTEAKFHVLTLVDGESVELHALQDRERKIEIKYSETVVIPACFGKYRIVNQGQEVCKIAKARLR